ncbi:protein kinase family protein [Paenibacillus alba]|uniref:Aminoglycoside phosphotransferase family protein n=1 Tax=Paenibacillus alba TaxID=1197127 RepID=A0ABU6GE52_9BACL|nr:hypothetical protein [Paenibacillus alba]MEC0231925.1 aminoglycoside phosphotransferase family protein [Paenibacillus alba]
MAPKPDVNEIIKYLRESGVIESNTMGMKSMSGTTDGLVYALMVDNEPSYVLKLDTPQNLEQVELLHLTYNESTLLPKLLYTDPNKTYMLYRYISGTTHYNRGSKVDWLTRLVNGLLNHYTVEQATEKWGFWKEEPCQTWSEFLDKGVEYARMNVGNLLPEGDYDRVKSLVRKSEGVAEERYLLHGDCGVHNFVFNRNSLQAVIDPSPIVGPVRYDYIYAFCSSPDDLNLETLFRNYTQLTHNSLDRQRLMEDVLIQLYCRIGICLKHHPHDLSEYLKAWNYWKELV